MVNQGEMGAARAWEGWVSWFITRVWGWSEIVSTCVLGRGDGKVEGKGSGNMICYGTHYSVVRLDLDESFIKNLPQIRLIALGDPREIVHEGRVK